MLFYLILFLIEIYKLVDSTVVTGNSELVEFALGDLRLCNFCLMNFE